MPSVKGIEFVYATLAFPGFGLYGFCVAGFVLVSKKSQGGTKMG